MEKFSKFFGGTYFFSEQYSEIPTAVRANMEKAITLDHSVERFLCAAWIQNFLSKGQIFVIVTDKRVISKDPTRIEQNQFRNVTGVEKDLFKNIVIKSGGNTSALFGFSAIASDKLGRKLFIIINSAWLQYSTQPAPGPTNLQDRNIEILKNLAQLRDQGVLTEEEFSKKKSEILNKI